MSKPTDKKPAEPNPDENPAESTVEMPVMKIVPDLSIPPDTLIMPAFKLPNRPHLGEQTPEDNTGDSDKK